MDKDYDKILNFLREAGKLKSTFRFNAADNVPKDSSAAHSWRLSLMAFVLADELKLKINTEHALKIAIVHDIVEAVAGDIDYRLIFKGKVTKEEKQRSEREAIEKLKQTLCARTGEMIYELWKEYEDGLTSEAKFIKALDKLETTIHIVESGYKSVDVPELIAKYADSAVSNFPELTDMLKAVKQKLKAEFAKGDIPWKEEYDIK